MTIRWRYADETLTIRWRNAEDDGDDDDDDDDDHDEDGDEDGDDDDDDDDDDHDDDDRSGRMNMQWFLAVEAWDWCVARFPEKQI